QKAAQHLLVGQQRVAAEAWLLTEFLGGKQPPCQPATLMCEFICEARKQAEDRMTDIFLCYAPKETDLCHQVVQSLSRHAKTCWTYDSDIQTGSQSERAIEQGIEGADNFGLFLSPVISESRRHELAYALKYNKRIIPLLVAPTAAEQIPNALRGLQRIDLTETHRAAGFETLLRILRNEHAYYERHKVLLVRALKWIEGNHKPMFLLRGYNLETAKVWLQINQNRPGQPPLPLHQTLITASETAISDQSGTQVYISYSRQDNDFVRQLNTRLQEAGKSTWFDQENQTKNTNADVDFEAEAFKSIASADNLVLVLSPASAASNYCQREIKQAAELGKRIINLLCRETDANTIPNALQSLPWLDFNRSDFDQAFLALVEILERQTDYVRRHTDILVQALHWQQNQRATQHLLVGKQRQAAEQWLKTEFLGGKQPPCQPTALMCEYICQARKNAENLMTDIFICYDEQDKAIRNQVIQSLSRYAKTCWTHVSDIQKGANYERAIEQGIENADNFCYFISPYAVASDYCQRELNHALQYNKRVVPLLIAPTPASAFPEALQGLQYIDLTDNTCQADYDSDIDDILNILKHEQDYYKQHKVLQVLALKWATENRNPAFLLRGHNLENAQIWLRLSNKRQQHPPLELHHQLITASEAAKGQLGTEVFISYSRKDGDFARHLNTVLQEAGKTTWFDQVSISTGVDFEKKIYKGIDGADNFVFVISPDAVQSEYCKREVNYAADNSKRFISVLHRETSPDTMPLALRKIHWIDFKDTTFDKSCRKLIQAIELDREHVHQHTMLQQRAHDWAENNRSADFLLNITACANAESWQTTAQNKLPAPTVLQLDFIENSRQAIKANKWRKALMILTTVSMIAAVILAVVAVVQMNEADVERQKANVERENAKQAEKTAEKQTLLAEQERQKANVCEKAKPEPTKAGRVFQNALKDGGLGPEMIWLPAGKFRMGDIQGGGDDDEKPVHEVSIGRFAMSRYEVTFDEYDRFAEATSRNKPRDRGWGRGKRPVISVFWHDAVDYVKWLSEQTQKPYRLPSEAEWEYAARAGTDTKYYWGNQSGVNFGHFRGSGSEWSVQQTAPVGSFAPNDFGIYDTVGNVWEWVADPWHSSYDNAPSDGSVWKGEGDFRVLRGGSFNDFSFSCRAAYRGRNTSGLRSCDLGFRVAVGVVAWTE
ncbi:MAG TPA: TIR domain-containing protein, partial [Thioploca sp.]|nr:TIR domain-containing protein [Thioploca sp.]